MPKQSKYVLYLKKFWNFVWNDDSLLSWIVNVILAFLIVKFLLYPGLGLLLGTTHPVVAVVSESMEHNPGNFEQWWSGKESQYAEYNIKKEMFEKYKLKNGFNKGDLVVLTKPKNVRGGDIIVFQSTINNEPIIHRVVFTKEIAGKVTYQTRGDNNPSSGQYELIISQEQLIGKAIFKIPYLGWFKLSFMNLFKFIS